MEPSGGWAYANCKANIGRWGKAGIGVKLGFGQGQVRVVARVRLWGNVRVRAE